MRTNNGRRATGPNKTQEKILKDITNKLAPGPIKLKASWVRPKMKIGEQQKGVKRINPEWVAEDVVEFRELGALNTPSRPTTDLRASRSTEGRPPDPNQQVSTNTQLPYPNLPGGAIDGGSNGQSEGIGAQVQGEEDEHIGDASTELRLD